MTDTTREISWISNGSRGVLRGSDSWLLAYVESCIKGLIAQDDCPGNWQMHTGTASEWEQMVAEAGYCTAGR